MVKAHPIFPSQLKKHTQDLLNQRIQLKKFSFVFISNETGLSQTWLAMFARNELKHTDVGRVETLYKYLSNKELQF